MIVRFLAAAVLAAAPLASKACADELKSQYSSLQDCAPVDRLALPGRTLRSGGQTAIQRCPGVAGYSVYVVDLDPRGFLVLERGEELFSLERPMVGAFSLGLFPNVAGAKKAEWRLDARGAVVGLIVRVSYLRSDDNKPASTLMAFDLRGAPVLLGAAPTNEEARGLLDGAVGAGGGAAEEEKLARKCNAIYAELCKGIAPGPEMVGYCFDHRPGVADAVPPECVADFQTNVENYHEAMRSRR